MAGIISPFLNTGLQVFRHRGLKSYEFISTWMLKTKRARMQGLTWQNLKTVFDKLLVFRKRSAFQNFVAAIAFVIEKCVANVFHVHTNLVRTAGFQPTGNKGHIPKRSEERRVGKECRTERSPQKYKKN